MKKKFVIFDFQYFMEKCDQLINLSINLIFSYIKSEQKAYLKVVMEKLNYFMLYNIFGQKRT